jgi:DNA polymerase elongation subunit (family B)
MNGADMFYTNVEVLGDNILFRGVQNGRRIAKKIQYSPKLYTKANKKTQWKTLQGEYLEELPFTSISEARDFVKKYEGIENFKIYGFTRYPYAFLSEAFPKEVPWEADKICVAYIDIEVASDEGFPEPDLANKEITAITLFVNGTYQVFGCQPYNNNRDDVNYRKFSSEYSLLKEFVEVWASCHPDIVTGWNSKFFDIPYLVNRITNVLGNDVARRMSPWNRLNERTATFKGKEAKTYDIVGVVSLDYIELYRKYAPNPNQDSFRLDNIAHVELGEKKLDYSEYGSLLELYKTNYQKFIEYNIKDVELVVGLEKKMKLIELAMTLAYDSKTNFDDVFSQVRMWDVIIYNHLRGKGIIIPPNDDHTKSAQYAGAYVKDVQVGMHDWVASFDLTSLYPSLIMMYNISPETLVQPTEYTEEMHRVISQKIDVDSMLAREVNTDKLKNLKMTLCPNGQLFRTEKEGFLPTLMRQMFADRKRYKNLMTEAEKELEAAKKAGTKDISDIVNRVSRYKNLQMAKKVCLNSAYGSLGNKHFRFYDIRMAEGITLSGQLSIRWIEDNINRYLNKLLSTDKDYVIASDTDSVYIRFDELVKKVFGKNTDDKRKIIQFMDTACKDKIQPYISKCYAELADYVAAFDQTMDMKREALGDRAIWTAKKRYIINVYNNEGVEYAEPKMKIMGLEAIKSSTPLICRNKIKQAFKIILGGTELDLRKFIAEFRAEYNNAPLSDIAFPRGVNGIKEYGVKLKDVRGDINALRQAPYKSGTPIHTKGALIYNHMLDVLKLEKKYPKIEDGDKIKFVYLKQPNKINSNVLSFHDVIPKEFDIQDKVHYNMLFEKTFLDPLQIVLDSIGWKAEESSSLEDLFS